MKNVFCVILSLKGARKGPLGQILCYGVILALLGFTLLRSQLSIQRANTNHAKIHLDTL